MILSSQLQTKEAGASQRKKADTCDSSSFNSEICLPASTETEESALEERCRVASSFDMKLLKYGARKLRKSSRVESSRDLSTHAHPNPNPNPNPRSWKRMFKFHMRQRSGCTPSNRIKKGAQPSHVRSACAPERTTADYWQHWRTQSY